MIEFPVGDHAVAAHLALPKSGEGPGVLVLHAWWGLNDFFKQVCDRLAREGFVALAPDLYHGNIATTIEEAQRLSKERDDKQALADMLAAVTYLRQHPAVQGQGIGCVGFSMGAWSAFELSCVCPLDIVAVAAFYGSGPEADYSAARAVYQGHFAVGDEWEEDEYVNQLETRLREAGREVTFYRYSGVGHWFMEENRPDVYNAEAARLAWQRTLDFLHSALVK